MSTLLQDVRYGLRTLWKSPAFTLIAVLAMALGIGATSTVFSFVDAVLLRPMAYKDLDRLVVVWGTIPKENVDQASVSAADFLDWAAQNHSFGDMTASTGWEANLTGEGDPELVHASLVTPNYFTVLGVQPALGRALLPADADADARAVVLAHGFWKQRLGGDPKIVGKSLTLNGQNYSVVGVMSEDVEQLEDLWRPLAFTPEARNNRERHPYSVIARLLPGVSVRQADAEMKTIAARLARQYPLTNAGRSARTVLLREDMTFGTRQYTLTLMGASIFVLLLACANVANLQLARTLARQKEIAVRAALGANRWRVVRQILVETTLVSGAGGILGLMLAAWGIDLTHAAIPASVMRVLAVLRHVQLDARVVAFTVVVSVGAGLLSGLVAALHASHTNLNDALKEGGRTDAAVSSRRPVRAGLVVTEVALALVLLVGAGLMVRGFRRLLLLNQGYEPRGLLTLHVSLQRGKYADQGKRAEFYGQVVRGLQSVPGVEAAASATFLPAGRWGSEFFHLEGRPELLPDQRTLTGISSVTPDYFRAMQIPLVKGRLFTEKDGRETMPVVLINASMARQYCPNEDPIGKRLRLLENADPPWRTIVGVVGDVKWPFDRSPRLITYRPVTQGAPYGAAFVLRASGDPTALATAARTQVRLVDPEQAIYDVRSMESILGDQISGVRVAGNMMMIFALTALALAAAGIYAVMAYSVVQRTHEIGVRMALGAQQRDMLAMVIGHACKLSALGLAIGAAAAIGVSRVLSSILFGVLDMDSLTFIGLVVLLGLVALVACYIPARRASRVDPMVALRYE